MSKIPFRNSEGYADPTAHAALTPIQQAQDDADRRLAQLIRELKYTIDQAGFDLLARIEVQDRKTGRIYR